MNTNNDTVLCLPCHWVMPCKKLELKISWKKFFKFPLLTTISAINFLCLNNYQKIFSSPHISKLCCGIFFQVKSRCRLLQPHPVLGPPRPPAVRAEPQQRPPSLALPGGWPQQGTGAGGGAWPTVTNLLWITMMSFIRITSLNPSNISGKNR